MILIPTLWSLVTRRVFDIVKPYMKLPQNITYAIYLFRFKGLKGALKNLKYLPSPVFLIS